MASPVNTTNMWDTQQTRSLEEEYEDLAFPDMVDVNTSCGFKDFIIPNELNPEELSSHMDSIEDGEEYEAVSTGTVRSDFLLLAANPKYCRGLITIDINPKVKAYRDFDLLLRKIAQTRAEYETLSSEFNSFTDRIAVIADKVKKHGFPQRIENYYLKHLDAFGHIYLYNNQVWKKDYRRHFKKCKFYASDPLFNKLQKYALSGNSINIIGNINDLKFLRNRNIGVVDTSNIHAYSLINLQIEGASKPLIIWTSGKGHGHTIYSSIPYTAICNEEEKKEFDRLVTILVKGGRLRAGADLSKDLHDLLSLGQPTLCFSKSSLKILQHHVEKLVIEDKALGPICIDCTLNHKFNNLSLEETQVLIKNPKTKQLLHIIFGKWESLTAQKFLVFCQIEGWQDAFEREFRYQVTILPKLLNHLSREGVLDQFKVLYGADRLQAFQASLEK